MSHPFASRIIRGSLLIVAPANPPAGTGYALTLPASSNFELLYARFTVVASIAAANRYLMINFQDPGGTTLYRNSPVATQTASQSRTYYASQGNNNMPTVLGDSLQLAIPPANVLGPTYRIYLELQNADAADQMSNITITLISHALPL